MIKIGDKVYYYQTMNKVGTVTNIITEKNNNKDLIIFSDFKDKILKTKDMNNLLNKFNVQDALVILDKSSKEKIIRSIKNIPNIKVTDVNHFSSYDLIKFNKIIFTETSMKELEKKYA